MTRNESKRRYLSYREAAIRKYESDLIKILPHANVQMTEDGAFVEAQIWIPIKEIDDPCTPVLTMGVCNRGTSGCAKEHRDPQDL